MCRGARAATLPCMQTTPQPSSVLPTFDARALARRAALPAALAALAAAVVVAVGGPLQALVDALGRALDADPRWVGAAAVLELLSFGGYIALLWLVGSRASTRMGPRESAHVTLGGTAATRLLPTGGLGGAALTLLAFRRAGLGTRDATRTLLVFLVLLYAVFLGSDRRGRRAARARPRRRRRAARAQRGARRRRPRWPSPPRSGWPLAGPLEAAPLRPSRRRSGGCSEPLSGKRSVLVRSGDARLLGALAWWGFDAAVLWAMLNALGAPPSLSVVVLAYFVGQVANTIPIPGAVSGGMVGVLVAFGVETDLALARGAGLPLGRDLAARSARPRGARQPPQDARPLGRRGRIARAWPARPAVPLAA